MDRIEIENIGSNAFDVVQFGLYSWKVSAPKVEFVRPDSDLGVKLSTLRKLIPFFIRSRGNKKLCFAVGVRWRYKSVDKDLINDGTISPIFGAAFHTRNRHTQGNDRDDH